MTLALGSRVIPERLPKTMPADLSRHAETLVGAVRPRPRPAGARRRRGLAPGPGHGDRRGAHPAAVAAHRPAGVPGHGDDDRRARRARGPAPRARTRARRDQRSWPAMPCCSTARGPRSRSMRATGGVLVVDQPGARAPPGRAAGPGRRAGARHPRPDDRRARDRDRALGGRGAGRGGGARRHAGAHVRGGVPRHLVDDRRARGRDDPAVDGDDPDGRRGPHRRRAGRRRAGPRAVRAACRAVRRHGGVRAADQQHGDGADRDPDRARGGRRSWASTSGRC